MSTPIRILIVEDNPMDADLILMRLARAGFQPDGQIVETEADYRAALSTIPDLILADWSLPQFSGLQALRILKEEALDIPFIILSGSIGEEAAVQAMRLGAYDYLLKDRPERLGQAVRNALEQNEAQKEHQRVARALQTSEENYRLLVENLTDLIVKTDLEGRFLFVSASYCQLFGQREEDLLGKTYVPLVYEEDLPVVEKAVAELMKPPYMASYQERARTIDGWRWIEWQAKAILNEHNTATAFIGTGRDITEQKQAQIALEESNKKLELLFDLLPVGLSILNQDRQITKMNPALEKILDITKEDLLKGAYKKRRYLRADGSLMPPEEFASSRVFNGEAQAMHVQTGVEKEDGSLIWTDVSAIASPMEGWRAVMITADITEPKRTQQALAASEAELRALFAAMRDVVLVIDAQGVYRKIAPTNPDLLVSPIQDLLGTKLHDVFTTDQADKFIQTIHTVLKTRQVQYIEYALNIRGNTIWFESAISPMTFDSVVWVARDITGRKQAEEDLRTQSSALNAAANAIVITDVDGQIEWVNPAFGRLTGFTLEEAAGKNPRELVRSGLHERSFYQEMWDTILAGQVWHGELTNRRKDGQLYVEEQTITPVCDSTGKIRQFIAIKQDISQRKQAEAALRESEGRYRSLFKNNYAVMLLVDPQSGLIIDANPAAVEFYGWSMEELAGRKISEINLLTEEQIALEMELARSQKRQSFLFRHQKKNGQVCDVEVFSGPIEWDGKTLLYSIVHDVTARKQAEAALKRKGDLQAQSAALGQDLAAARSLTAIYQTAERHLKQMIDCPAFGITLFDAQKALLTAAYLSADGEMIDVSEAPPLPYNPQNSASGRSEAIAARKPIIVRQLEARQKANGGIILGAGKTPQSAIYVPMLAEEQVIGLLDLQSYQEDAYTEEDGQWLILVANQISMAIQNARLLAKTRQRLAELSALHAIDTAVTAHLGPQKTFAILLQQIAAQLNVDAVDILLLNPQADLLSCVQSYGFSTDIAQRIQLQTGEGLAWKSILENRIIHTNSDIQNQYTFFEKEEWSGESFASYWGIPLLIEQKAIGVLEVFHRTPLHPEAEWLHLLTILAGQAAIAVDQAQLFQNIQKANVELLQAYDATIAGWSQAMDLRDKETEGHTRRVTEMTVEIARAFNIAPEILQHIRRGALLHDMGKLGVPDRILLKPGPLTEEEWIVMKRHPEYAYQMLLPIQYLQPALDIPYCHHEKWDGSGYPRGLKGTEIPLAARIFTITDVWDALTSDRPYRPAWSRKDTIEYLKKQAGKQFDPEVVTTFLKIYHFD